MSETVETHEHAEEAAHGGRRHTALLIAVLAAGLAFSEQGAQHADTRMSQSAVAASDVWSEYQAKSTRANDTRDLAALAGMIQTTKPDEAAAVQARFTADLARFETDPKSGKAALAEKAKKLEEVRDAAHERLEAFDNASAALQLGIVLTTASVITGSLMLAWGGALLGAAGGILAILGLIAPSLASW